MRTNEALAPARKARPLPRSGHPVEKQRKKNRPGRRVFLRYGLLLFFLNAGQVGFGADEKRAVADGIRGERALADRVPAQFFEFRPGLDDDSVPGFILQENLAVGVDG